MCLFVAQAKVDEPIGGIAGQERPGGVQESPQAIEMFILLSFADAFQQRQRQHLPQYLVAVSYTHLTLPTNREV